MNLLRPPDAAVGRARNTPRMSRAASLASGCSRRFMLTFSVVGDSGPIAECEEVHAKAGQGDREIVRRAVGGTGVAASMFTYPLPIGGTR